MSSGSKKRNAETRKDGKCEESPCQSKDGASHEIGNSVWASGSGREEIRGSHTKFSGGEGGAKEQVRLLRACGSAELGKVASDYAMQGLCLENRKVRYQVIGKDQSRLPGRGTVEEVRGRKMRKKSQQQNKGESTQFRVRFGREKRASRLPCLSLGDDRRSTSRSEDVSLTIFITSVSCSKSLRSFTNHFFHFSRPPGFRVAFDAAERNEKFSRSQCQRRAAAEERDEYSSAEGQ